MSNPIEITLLGATNSGKTSLIKRLIWNNYDENTESSTYIDTYHLDISDQTDQDKPYSFAVHVYPEDDFENEPKCDYTKHYFYMLAFDTTDQNSWNIAVNLAQKIKRLNPWAMITFIGTKTDLQDNINHENIVPDQFVNSYVTENGMSYIKTSAHANDGIKEIKAALVKQTQDNPKLVLLQKLQAYVDSVAFHTWKANDIDFEFGFKSFKGPQGKNRHANFLLARALIKELQSDKTISEIFSNKNIDTLRNHEIRQANIKLSLFWPKTVRGGVKAIIDEAKTMMPSNIK